MAKSKLKSKKTDKTKEVSETSFFSDGWSKKEIFLMGFFVVAVFTLWMSGIYISKGMEEET